MPGSLPEVNLAEAGSKPEKQPIELGTGLDSLDPHVTNERYITQLEKHKTKFQEHISKINDKLTSELDEGWTDFSGSLDVGEEYNGVVQQTQAELDQIEAEFNEALQASDGSEYQIINALMDLNSSLDTFVSSKLDKIISGDAPAAPTHVEKAIEGVEDSGIGRAGKIDEAVRRAGG